MRYSQSEQGDVVLLEPVAAARASVLWLHGLGADGHDFAPLIPQLSLADSLPVRFLLPHAPMRPVTLNGGLSMRAWYDIMDAGADRREDRAGLIESGERMGLLIQREIAAGIPASRILLAGFSQGGAVALHAGLRYGQALGGIVALSTYLPLPERLSAEGSAANRRTPILMCHGRQDEVIPLQWAQRSRDLLQEQGYEVLWHEYPMQHQVCPAEIETIAAWLSARLAPRAG